MVTCWVGSNATVSNLSDGHAHGQRSRSTLTVTVTVTVDAHGHGHGPRPTGPRASGCHSYRGGELRMSLVSIAETRSARSWAATAPHERADVVLIGWSAFEVSFGTIFADGWGILIELAIEMTQVFRRHASTQ